MKVNLKDLENKMDLNVSEIHSFLKHHNSIVWSWGAKSWTNVKNKGLAFNVSGFKFKGNVMITVNGMDVFDIYFYNRLGKKVNEFNDVYLEDLIEVLDNNIEKVDDYKKKVEETYSF